MPKSDATVSADHAALLAERYGFPVVDGARARLIAALHALINWMIEHPNVPVPGYIELRHFPVMDGGKLTRADLIDLAHTLDGEIDAGPAGAWMKARLLPPGSGAQVEYVAFEGDFSGNARPL